MQNPIISSVEIGFEGIVVKIDTYNNKEGSIRQVSARFKVSRSFVQKFLKQHQQMGSLAPLPHGGGTPPKLSDYLPEIEKFLEEKNDATLPELCQKLKESQGIRVSPSTLCRFLQKVKLTRKKNFSGKSSSKRTSTKLAI